MRKLVFLASMVLFTFCNSADDYDINCTSVFVYGLNVSVVNADTQTPITTDITVTATDEDYSEELMLEGNVFLGAGERPGDYTITAVAVGYQSGVSEVITVDADICHVFTEFVELQLTPN